MPRIDARRCRFTGGIFTSNTEFAKHLRKLRKEQRAQRKVNRIVRECQSVFTQMRATCRTPADIEQFIRDHWEHFVIHARQRDKWGRQSKTLRKPIPKLLNIEVTFTWGSFTYGRETGLISNTHAAPLTGPWAGKTNWGGMNTKDGVPRGYLGWDGEIKFAIEEGRDEDVSGSDFFEHTGLFTGSGGGGGKSYRYGLELFADDWPAMYDEHSRKIVRRKLGFTDAESA